MIKTHLKSDQLRVDHFLIPKLYYTFTKAHHKPYWGKCAELHKTWTEL